MNTRTISGVEINATPHTSRHGIRYWQATVTLTGVELPQHYETRPKMWDELEHIAKLIGDERFQRDLLNAK